jgi:hypothetical protein
MTRILGDAEGSILLQKSFLADDHRPCGSYTQLLILHHHTFSVMYLWRTGPTHLMISSAGIAMTGGTFKT